VNNDGNAGVIVESGQKIYGLQRKTQQTWLHWKKLRLVIAWPMILVFAGGSLALWWGAINSLIATGGFAGIVSWQVLGFFLPVYQGIKIHGRVTARKESGAFLLADDMRWRLWAIIIIIALNALANFAAIILVIWNLAVGRLNVSFWDTAAFVLAGAAILLLVVWKRRRILKDQTSTFFLASGTRMMPQVALAFSLDLKFIPWLALGGVGAIALQRFLVSSIELAEARSERVATESLLAARWVWRGDVGNLVTIAVPVVAKLLL
jgi:hypothetical protein